MLDKRRQRDELVEFSRSYSIRADIFNEFADSLGTSPLKQGTKLYDLILRPQLSVMSLANVVPALARHLDTIE